MNNPRVRRSFAALAIVAIATATAACGDSGKSSGAMKKAKRSAASADNVVTMRLIAFRPDNLTVKAGTTVTWSQTDAGVHTVTSGAVEQGTGGVTEVPDGRFDSGSIAKGDSFKFTFDQAGTYAYFCHIHPATMRGEVRVT
ncbi:MAG TPA: plastocyanin/azurin family copper-binding protein [Acidimicrobiales bacterium]|nr:plastocyanin/azurin family copper-binding protein [Acidimicrobiales bacterium]